MVAAAGHRWDAVTSLLGQKLSVHQTREEWLAARETRIGGSDVSAILGISPYKGPWDVYLQKRLGQSFQPDAATQQVLDEGRRWESAVLRRYAAMAGVELIRPPHGLALVTSLKQPWASGSLDSFVWDKKLGLGLVEGKTDRTGADQYGESGTVIDAWGEGAERVVRPVYVPQAYWYRALTGLAFADFVVALPRGFSMGEPPEEDLEHLLEVPKHVEVRWFRLMPDTRTEGAIYRRVSAWRQRHLVDGAEPEWDGSDACKEALKLLHPDKTGRLRGATPEEASLVTATHEARKAQRAAERLAKTLENKLHKAIGDDYGLRLGPDGPVVKLSRSENGTRTFRFNGF